MLKNYPKLYDAATFERLVRDVMGYQLGIPFQLYGRNGQLQSGIDLFARINNQEFIVVQCKNYLSKKSVKEIQKIIEEEIEKSNQLNITILEFWFVTALNRDTKIQYVKPLKYIYSYISCQK